MQALCLAKEAMAFVRPFTSLFVVSNGCIKKTESSTRPRAVPWRSYQVVSQLATFVTVESCHNPAIKSPSSARISGFYGALGGS